MSGLLKKKVVLISKKTVRKCTNAIHGVDLLWGVYYPKDKCEVTVQCVESQHRRSQEDDGVLCCWGPPACTFIKSLQLCQWSHCIIPPMEECSSS